MHLSCLPFLYYTLKSSRDGFNVLDNFNVSSIKTTNVIDGNMPVRKQLKTFFTISCFRQCHIYGPQTTHSSPTRSVGGLTLETSPLLSLHLEPLSKYQGWAVSADTVPHVSLQTEHFIVNYINLSAVFRCTDLKHLH